MTLWEDVLSWRAFEWERFLMLTALSPRTYCVFYALGTALLYMSGATPAAETTNCLLALYAVAVLSI